MSNKDRKEEIKNEEKDKKVTANIIVPKDGGWGWVVVFASFCIMFIQTANMMTYGTIVNPICTHFQVPIAAAALINSLQTSFYFMTSPFAAAFINRFGFRACGMFGSVICSFSILAGYLSPTYLLLLLSYGFVNGIGSSFSNMASLLILGFYFNKRRVLALSLATNGYSLGIIVMFPFYSYLNYISGWRSVILLQSGMAGITYFCSLTYRPLLSVAITSTKEDEKQSISEVRQQSTKTKEEGEGDTKESKVAPITVYPTAAELIKDKNAELIPSKAGTSSARSSLTVKPLVNSPMNDKQLREVRQSIGTIQCEFVEPEKQFKKEKSFWAKIRQLFHWEKHRETNPLYRDDVFYRGKVEDLKVYKENVPRTEEDRRNSLEYHLAVTRAVSVANVKEEGLFTKSFKRVLTTMLDFGAVLKEPSFRIFCLSGFTCYVGIFTPYVFLTARNKEFGLESDYYISAISLSTMVGRFFLTMATSKLNPVVVYSGGLMVAGLSTILSTLVYTFPYQYGYCMIFGTSVSVVTSLRIVCLVKLYGLSRLTNVTGIFYFFLGFGAILSTPSAGLIKSYFGYNTAFQVSGLLIFLSGFLTLLLRNKKDAESN